MPRTDQSTTDSTDSISIKEDPRDVGITIGKKRLVMEERS